MEGSSVDMKNAENKVQEMIDTGPRQVPCKIMARKVYV